MHSPMHLHTLDIVTRALREMTAGRSSAERCDSLAAIIRGALGCDAVAVLRSATEGLSPVAMQGLDAERLAERLLVPADHPRLAAAVASHQPLRFLSDDPRPDPYEGVIFGDEDHPRIHSCVAIPLAVDEAIVGVLTLDALRPGAFDGVDDQSLEALGALAAASLQLVPLEAPASVHEEFETGPGSSTEQRDALLGQGAAMVELREQIAIVARTDLNVLITGETGVGKEVVARTVHARSARAAEPLVYVNCAALPDALAESELFGHVTGAFTGANRERAGKFELGDGGTLFLDEVGELSPSIQAKLLRAIQFGEIQRVGSDRALSVDTRVIAATNRDLRDEVAQGRFREDLFHRLNVYPINVPPLRERDDVLALASHFLEHAERLLGLPPVSLSPAAAEALRAHPWPGNVRELEHVLQRASLRAAHARRAGDRRIELSVRDLGLSAPRGTARAADTIAPGSLADATKRFQTELVLEMLAKHDGNWTAAARALKVDRSNLSRIAKRLGITAGVGGARKRA